MRARSTLLLVLLSVLLGGSRARAGGMEEAPAARATGDEEGLHEAATPEATHPWIVAERLIEEGRHAAAAGFAESCSGPRTARLAEYVARRESGDDDAGATVRSILTVFDRGRALRESGKLVESGREFLAAAEAAESLGWWFRASEAFYEAALSAARRSDFEAALSLRKRRLAVEEKLEEPDRIPAVLDDIGIALRNLGRSAEALRYLERALALRTTLGDREGQAISRQNLGAVYVMLGDHARAREHFEVSVALARETGDRLTQATVLANLGIVLARDGDPAKGAERLAAAAEILTELGDYVAAAKIHTNRGYMLIQMGRTEEAIEAQEKGLAVLERSGDRFGYASALATAAGIWSKLGRIERALGFSSRALAVASELEVPDQNVRIRALHAHLLLLAGRPGDAVPVAREGVELVRRATAGLPGALGAGAREAHAKLFELGLAAALNSDRTEDVLYFLEAGRAGGLLESLDQRQRLLDARLSPELAKAERTARERERVALTAWREAAAGGVRSATAAARRDLDTAREQRRRVIERLQREAGAVAGVAFPDLRTAAAIRQALGPDEALAVYGLVFDQAIAVVVTRSGVRPVELGSREEIAVATARATFSGADPDHPVEAVHDLRRVLLDPLALPDSVRRLLVSPDPRMSNVPLGLLGDDLEICFVPSGSAWAALTALGEGRGEGVLAIGDPDSGDGAPSDVVAKVRSGPGPLAPLPGAAQEAEAIGDTVLLGAEATERAFIEALGREPHWRSLHFACHGFADAERPGLSWLALAPDRENDGYLTAQEVMLLRARSDLVVLSACETGGGKAFAAEGLLGLARSFMAAGAPRVICSLWKVDDAATRALMTKFYELWNPEGGGTGLGAAAALKGAQAWVRSREEWRHPYYWAAWVLWGLPE